MAAPSLTQLPIDEHIEAILEALDERPVVLVEAAPGAGKTTRVPYALLGRPWCRQKVLVSEPRRIAARLAATRVASERNLRLGSEVGYRVRFDEKATKATRIEYMTEGLLLRRLLEGDGLQGVSAIVLDEVHERSEDLDVLLALLKRALDGGAAFRLVLMSATLDASPLRAHFDAPHLKSEGRSFPVEVSHDPKDDERPLPIRVRSAVKKSMGESGDMLVFLPGASEIRAAKEALDQLPELEIVLLHGDLPLAEQARVLAPGNSRRVVLSTNVAESSVTIPGVTTVIDSGLARAAHFDPWSGVTRLETTTISRARSVQRAGRAGRIAPGRALRLYTKGAFERRPAQDTPELLRADLSAITLRLISASIQPEDLPWLTPPDERAWAQAKDFLEGLGALDRGQLTPAGKAMAGLPLPVRLARIVVAGCGLGIRKQTCLAAALLSERDISRRGSLTRDARNVEAGDSDLELRLEAIELLRGSRFDNRTARDLGVDLETARQVDRVGRALESATANLEGRANAPEEPGAALTRALLSGFADRVAQRKGARELVLEVGTQATLDESSCVVHAPLLLALSADAPGGRRRKASVRIAHRLDADLILDVLGDRVVAREELIFVPDKERVDTLSELRYGKLVLDESRAPAAVSPETTEVLLRAALERGPRSFDPEGHLESLFERLRLLKQYFPKLAPEDLDSDESLLEIALRAAATTRTSLAELRAAPLQDELLYALDPQVQEALRRELPLEVVLQGGRRLAVHYDRGKPPWIESRLQDFFGMKEGLSLCAGRLPLQIHFLAPNQRALQVTTDLPGFWERHYPDLRKQLMRRYPKHLWPEDGANAKPPTPGRIR